MGEHPLLHLVGRELPVRLNDGPLPCIHFGSIRFSHGALTGSPHNRTGFVSARLLNVPADKALELLAVQADLRVVKRGSTFLVTSRDHANALADEAVEGERRKAEVKQLRTQGPPPAPPEPPKPGM